ncbi:MAG: hypothetical protein ACRETQ_11035 [Gammaproteobacteria bacterium]
MTRHASPRALDLRRRLAQEAARLISEEGVRDFGFAKRKAAEHLGLDPRSLPLPTNLEVEDAVDAHQRLFRADALPARLRRLRETARAAMHLLAAFEPRLVGPVLAGTAPDYPVVHLHVFSDELERLTLFFMDLKIPYELGARKVKFGSGEPREQPVYRFLAGDVPIQLTVFGVDGIREAPLSPVDGRPTRRASLQDLERLLAR